MKYLLTLVVFLFCSVALSQEIKTYPYHPPTRCVWKYGPVDQLVEVTLIDEFGCLRHAYYWRRVTKWYKYCEPCHNLHILDGDEHERSLNRGVVSGDEPVERKPVVVRRKR